MNPNLLAILAAGLGAGMPRNWRMPDLTPPNPYATKPNTLSQKKRRQRARWVKGGSHGNH